MKAKRGGHLFIISAPSGTGKSTVIQKVMEMRSDLYFSVSATTRPPRAGEINGSSYLFMSHDEFLGLIRQNELLEYAEYIGNYYGTPKQPIIEHINRGNDIILDIDVQGCKQVKKAMPEAVSIFLIPPSLEELERRLRSRGTDADEKILKRLSRAKAELSEKGSYDHIVVNDSVEKAAAEIITIIDRQQ